jgi:uncharacterized membrane protein YfcA
MPHNKGLWLHAKHSAAAASAPCIVCECMTLTLFSAELAAASMLAGLIGALTGLGGGVLLVPLLILGFGVNVHLAAGASLVSVIATSSGAASSYVRDGLTNIRIGILLEVATTIGAVAGALVASHLSTNAIAVIFGIVLLYSAARTVAPSAQPTPATADDPIAVRLHLGGAGYGVQRVPLGFAVMAVAGALSGLLGIGSGALKVLAMDRIMRLPFKVSTTTSNFMIGVTAAASIGIYLRHGYIDPLLVWPVMLGVLAGALWGARLLPHVRVVSLRWIFSTVIVVLAVEMIAKGIQ